MKKLLSVFICVILSLVCAIGFTACKNDNSETAVNLVAIDANNVGLMADVDYYVVPEPAASAKVKALSDLNFVGDLQSLYGVNGYPQAVVVAKNSLVGTSILADFITAIKTSDEWLMNDDNSIESIVNAIQSHLTVGLEPTIKVQNLTKAVIKNCGIKFVSAADSKSEILKFMEKFNDVGNGSFGVPSDGFFFDGAEGGAEYSQNISVYAPDGAPALGLAALMAENSLKNVQYNIVNANTIQTFVSGAAPKADICVLPVNVAVKLLGNAQNYKLIGTLTHGNLYILSKNDMPINGDNIQELKGKTVGVVNLAQVPGLTLKLILKNYGIEFVEPYND